MSEVTGKALAMRLRLRQLAREHKVVTDVYAIAGIAADNLEIALFRELRTLNQR
jgi:hypothetical protein